MLYVFPVDDEIWVSSLDPELHEFDLLDTNSMVVSLPGPKQHAMPIDIQLGIVRNVLTAGGATCQIKEDY